MKKSNILGSYNTKWPRPGNFKLNLPFKVSRKLPRVEASNLLSKTLFSPCKFNPKIIYDLIQVN